MSLEWLAGFFDGEGCVGLDKDSPSSGGHGYRPRLTITQKDIGILSKVQQHFGGYLYSKGSGNPCSFLRWNGAHAFAMAQRLLPYTQCKHDQLQVLISAAEEAPEEREDYAILIRCLKQNITVNAA